MYLVIRKRVKKLENIVMPDACLCLIALHVGIEFRAALVVALIDLPFSLGGKWITGTLRARCYFPLPSALSMPEGCYSKQNRIAS